MPEPTTVAVGTGLTWEYASPLIEAFAAAKMDPNITLDWGLEEGFALGPRLVLTLKRNKTQTLAKETMLVTDLQAAPFNPYKLFRLLGHKAVATALAPVNPILSESAKERLAEAVRAGDRLMKMQGGGVVETFWGSATTRAHWSIITRALGPTALATRVWIRLSEYAKGDVGHMLPMPSTGVTEDNVWEIMVGGWFAAKDKAHPFPGATAIASGLAQTLLNQHGAVWPEDVERLKALHHSLKMGGGEGAYSSLYAKTPFLKEPSPIWNTLSGKNTVKAHLTSEVPFPDGTVLMGEALDTDELATWKSLNPGYVTTGIFDPPEPSATVGAEPTPIHGGTALTQTIKKLKTALNKPYRLALWIQVRHHADGTVHGAYVETSKKYLKDALLAFDDQDLAAFEIDDGVIYVKLLD